MDAALLLAVDVAERLADGADRGDALAPATFARRLDVLATLAAADVTVARIAEPHLDALAILAELGEPLDLGPLGVTPRSTWGVFAAESSDVRLDAGWVDGAWLLSGTKPWCSLAGTLTHALITAHTEDGRRLFAVSLRHPGVSVDTSLWVARGFPTVPSGPAEFDDCPAVPVGEPGWYLRRPGFAAGGIGVAACWFGGAVGLVRHLHAASNGASVDPLSDLHLGRAGIALHAARSALAEAARAIDGAGTAAAFTPARAALLAQLTRSVVRGSCETVLRETAHGLGPGPLTRDRAFAARVADLDLYLRQDHGERDEARAGRLLADERFDDGWFAERISTW
ncbi:acyl-CoA dehydrogenase [Herbiconiux moechotypicola]|uniref:Acyl-CoA dehydrogenase n=1 Tax=Herbiconiux moechotypicola TaxID=637393 RepID=A0ABN3DMG8_9MICO|nr:acyl-CoA dehydrogenase [Herbiconiux moechotypicola]MCS5730236.1 acyl-CoA dehydrogenase [Herbiconiux moechotypicola]